MMLSQPAKPKTTHRVVFGSCSNGQAFDKLKPKSVSVLPTAGRGGRA